jgi:hypothetical protein
MITWIAVGVISIGALALVAYGAWRVYNLID